jgi:hypothetical protein
MGGWKRIGIVLSVIWVFVGGFWGNNIGIHQGDFAMGIYDICLRTDNSDWGKCGVTVYLATSSPGIFIPGEFEPCRPGARQWR